MTWTMTLEVRETMAAAARQAFPLEACGLIGGIARRLLRCYVLTNVDQAADHFRLSPAEQFRAVQAMRAEGMRLRAIWHSHPSTPARLSEEDLRWAFTPDVLYVVVSLAQPDHPDIRGFEMRDGIPSAVPLVLEETPTESCHGS